jgi:hypothetical protein
VHQLTEQHIGDATDKEDHPDRPASPHDRRSYGTVARKKTLLREKPYLRIEVVVPATEPGDWQLLEKPLGVMPGRLFHLTLEGNMPNDKPLKPDDFPLEVEDEELVTADGKPIAKAKTPAIAEDIADRLSEDDQRKEQDRWSA